MLYAFIYILLFTLNTLAMNNFDHQKICNKEALQKISCTHNTVHAFLNHIAQNNSKNIDSNIRTGNFTIKSTTLLDTAIIRASSYPKNVPTQKLSKGRLRGGSTFSKLFISGDRRKHVDENSKEYKDNANAEGGKTRGGIEGKQDAINDHIDNVRPTARLRGLIAGVCWGPQNILAFYTYAGTPAGLLVCLGINIAGHAVYTMPCKYEDKTVKEAYNHTKFWYMAWPIIITAGLWALAAQEQHARY